MAMPTRLFALMCSLACPEHFHLATTCRISWPLPHGAMGGEVIDFLIALVKRKSRFSRRRRPCDRRWNDDPFPLRPDVRYAAIVLQDTFRRSRTGAGSRLKPACPCVDGTPAGLCISGDGRRLYAAEAKEAGLVYKLVETDELETRS